MILENSEYHVSEKLSKVERNNDIVEAFKNDDIGYFEAIYSIWK